MKHNRWVEGGKSRFDTRDPEYSRIYYIRYADDMLIGFTGTKFQAETIYSEVKEFLTGILLNTNDSKSKVIHGTEYTKFLGTLIKWTPNHTVTKNIIGEDVGRRMQVAHNRPRMCAPIVGLLQRAKDKGFAIARGTNTKYIRATSKRSWSSWDDKEIVTRFNTIIRGILQYYSFVNQRSDLWQIIDIYRKSCALTLADKHKLKTAARVFSKYGKYLKISNNVGKEVASLSAWPLTLKTEGKFQRGKSAVSIQNLDENVSIQASYKTLSKEQGSDTCQYEGCSAITLLEQHHLNPMINATRKGLSQYESSIIRSKRKMVTLCRKHHLLMHNKGILIKNFKEKKPTTDQIDIT